MPVRSRKHQQVKTLTCVPMKGLDLSTSPTAIDDNSLTRAYNLWYEPNINGLVTRYGLSVVDVAALPAAVSLLHYHVMADGTGHFMAATSTATRADALYRLVETDTGKAWEKLLDLETAGGDAPSLLSFDGVLLIADGRSGGLVAWDGKTVNEIKGSPSRPTIVDTIADRVVCNSLGSPDAVFFSEPEKYDGWSTISGGAALIIPAGFGEGMTINGMADLYGKLIVSKVHRDIHGNITQKRLHMIGTLGLPGEWYGVQLSQTSSAAAHNAIVPVGDKVFFLDSDGPQSLVPSPGGAYGDIAIDPKMGPKVHPIISGASRRATQAAVIWLRNLAQLWYIVRNGAADTVVVYHPMQGGAWTELHFPFSVRSLCEVGERVYIAGDDGRLYLLAPTGTDWTPEGAKDIFTTLRTKKYEQIGGDLILRGVKLGIGRIMPAIVRCEAISEGDVRSLVFEENTLETGSADQKIYDATARIANATWKIAGGSTAVPQYFDRKANVRKTGMFIQVRTVGGRVSFESVAMQFAVVG